MRTIKVTISVFITAVQKELIQQWRTKRFLITLGVFLLFGLVSPIMSKMLPELVKSEPGGEALVKLLPPPSAAEAVKSYISFIGTFGYFLAILLGMNAVAGEKESGTAGLILSKPMPRWVFILSKFCAQSLLLTLGVLAGTLAMYYCTTVLFGAMDALALVMINSLILLWLLIFSGATLLASVIGKTVATAAGLGLGLAVLLGLTGNIPHIGKWMPGSLMAWATELNVSAEKVVTNSGALIAALAMIAVFLIGSMVLFERQEIQ